jgi:hypothetical protein
MNVDRMVKFLNLFMDSLYDSCIELVRELVRVTSDGNFHLASYGFKFVYISKTTHTCMQMAMESAASAISLGA